MGGFFLAIMPICPFFVRRLRYLATDERSIHAFSTEDGKCETATAGRCLTCNNWDQPRGRRVSTLQLRFKLSDPATPDSVDPGASMIRAMQGPSQPMRLPLSHGPVSGCSGSTNPFAGTTVGYYPGLGMPNRRRARATRAWKTFSNLFHRTSCSSPKILNLIL